VSIRFPLAIALFSSALSTLTACLDIERTSAADSSGGAGGSSSGSGGASLDPDFVPTECLQQCIDKTPQGAPLFSAVSVCFERARAGTCAEACSSSAPGEEVPASSCTLASSVDPNPACNNCVKDNCCQKLVDCFALAPCIVVGICASGCGG
jgi:hypothetical protein